MDQTRGINPEGLIQIDQNASSIRSTRSDSSQLTGFFLIENEHAQGTVSNERKQ